MLNYLFQIQHIFILLYVIYFTFIQLKREHILYAMFLFWL